MLALLLIPLIGALFGWLTVYALIKLLFHPQKALNLGLIKIQGIIPSQKEAIKDAITDYSLSVLKPEQIIQSTLQEIDLQGELEPLLDGQLDNLVIALKQQIPMAAMFLSPQMIQKLKGIAKVEIIKMIPTLKTKLSDSVSGKLDLKRMIREQLDEADLSEMGAMIEKEIMAKMACWGGFAAVIGYLAGLLQLLLLG